MLKKVSTHENILVDSFGRTINYLRISDIIPYCHQIPLDHVAVDFELMENSICVKAQVKAIWKIGVEMEALTAVSVAALTIYDMLKPEERRQERLCRKGNPADTSRGCGAK